MKKLLVILILMPLIMSTQNKINKYQYWYDNNFSGVQTQTLTPQTNVQLTAALPSGTLPAGLHSVHLRFCDNSQRWSGTITQFFFKTLQNTLVTTNITSWEYWFDNNYAGKVVTPVSASQNVNISSAISTALLSAGLHVVHLRVEDNKGMWSGTISQFFFKSASVSPSTPNLVSWQYWYDNDFSSAVTQTTNTAQNIQLSSAVPAGSLSDGIHTFHIRFLDNSGKWSSTVSQFFFKSSNDISGTVQLTEFEYWFDSDYGSAITTTLAANVDVQLVSTLPTNAIPNGLHALHYRFKDSGGKWSSVASQFFFKKGVAIGTDNKITAYRYWFDTADTSIHNVQLVAANNVDLNNTISMVSVPKGTHSIHIQFKDSLGRWSSAITDTVNKLPLPIANFKAVDTLICDSGFVEFSDQSIDGDTYLWDFGDGETDTTLQPVHHYAAPGLYSVSLTVTDTASGLDSMVTYAQYVKVFDTPSGQLSVISNDSICLGNTANIMATPGYGYGWNTGDDAQNISVSSNGNYYANIYNLQYGACSRNSDTIHITVMPMPMAALGADTTICELAALDLHASNAGCTYLWNDNSIDSNLSVNNAGTYWVTITTSFGCVASDTIIISIDSLPQAGFNILANGLNCSFNNNTTYATGYLWSFGDGDTSTLANPSHSYVSTGVYTVTLIAFNSCDADTSIQIVSVIGMKEENTHWLDLKVYPNPASTMVHINFFPQRDENISIGLFNALGQLVSPNLKADVLSGHLHEVKLNIGLLDNGIYFIRVQGSESFATVRLVVSK